MGVVPCGLMPLPLLVIVGVDELDAVVTDDNAEGDGLVVESGLQLGDSRLLLFEFSTKLSLRSSVPGSIGSNQDERKESIENRESKYLGQADLCF